MANQTMAQNMATRKIAKSCAETALERAALKWINARAEDYDDVSGPINDLMYGGCQSGMVSELIYYTDTVKFYKKHRKDIGHLLAQILDGTGSDVSGLFGEKWDTSDPLANDTQNQNLLAWFGFEEAVRIVAYRAGIEV